MWYYSATIVVCVMLIVPSSKPSVLSMSRLHKRFWLDFEDDDNFENNFKGQFQVPFIPPPPQTPQPTPLTRPPPPPAQPPSWRTPQPSPPTRLPPSPTLQPPPPTPKPPPSIQPPQPTPQSPLPTLQPPPRTPPTLLPPSPSPPTPQPPPPIRLPPLPTLQPPPRTPQPTLSTLQLPPLTPQPPPSTRRPPPTTRLPPPPPPLPTRPPPPPTRLPPSMTRPPPPPTRLPPSTTRPPPPPTSQSPPPSLPPPPPTPQLPPTTWRLTTSLSYTISPFSYQGSRFPYRPYPFARILIDRLANLTGVRRLEDSENTCLNNKTCVRKCCPKGQWFDMAKYKCVIPDEFHKMERFNVSKEFHILNGQIVCLESSHEEKKRLSEVEVDYSLQSDGTLLVDSYRAAGPPAVLNTTKYCIDWFITVENKTEWNGFICQVVPDYETHFVFNGSCMLLICFLVLLRVVVFAWLPELRTLHGIILMAYLASFLVGYLLLGSKMLLMYKQSINRMTCVALTFIIYFSILSAFFWRNVMCYDIWRTFSGRRAILSRGSVSRTRLCLYCAYAFGGPTALTILLAVLEYSDFPREHELMPKLWHHGCNSLYGYSKLLYFYAPILTLFVINMVLFTLTAFKIASIKKETEMILQSKESGTHDQKNHTQRFILYVKLFAAMVFLEVNWIIEIGAIFYPDNKIILQMTDVYNVFILLVFLLNFLSQKQTWIVVKKRYNRISLKKRQKTKDPCPNSGKATCVLTSHTTSSHTSQSLDNTITTEYSREKMNPADSQDDTQSNDYSREKMNPAESQDDTQLTDYSRGKNNRAESQNGTITTDHSRGKSNRVESQTDTITTDYSREKSNRPESQNDTITTDYSREKMNPDSQYDTQSTDYSREKTNPAESQDDTQLTVYRREKTNPAESQNDTQLTVYSRGNTNPAESQDDTLSTDYSQEKSNRPESQNDTITTDYSREKMNPADSQYDTQSTDPAESHDDTVSIDYSREKTNYAQSQDDTQSTDCSRGKSNRADNQNDTITTDYS